MPATARDYRKFFFSWSNVLKVKELAGLSLLFLLGAIVLYENQPVYAAICFVAFLLFTYQYFKTAKEIDAAFKSKQT